MPLIILKMTLDCLYINVNQISLINFLFVLITSHTLNLRSTFHIWYHLLLPLLQCQVTVQLYSMFLFPLIHFRSLTIKLLFIYFLGDLTTVHPAMPSDPTLSEVDCKSKQIKISLNTIWIFNFLFYFTQGVEYKEVPAAVPDEAHVPTDSSEIAATTDVSQTYVCGKIKPKIYHNDDHKTLKMVTTDFNSKARL